MSEIILRSCKELIDDAKLGCADLVFKEVCLEILARAKNVLDAEDFEELRRYAAERMQETSPLQLEAETDS